MSVLLSDSKQSKLTVEGGVTAGPVADNAHNLVVLCPGVSPDEAAPAVPLAAVTDLAEAADGAAPDLDPVQVLLEDSVALPPVDQPHVVQLVQDVRLAPGVHSPQPVTRVPDDPALLVRTYSSHRRMDMDKGRIPKKLTTNIVNMVSSPLTPLPLKGLVNIFMVKIGKNFIPPTSSQDSEYQQIFLAPTRSPTNTK